MSQLGMYRVKWHGRSDMYTHLDRAIDWAERHEGALVFEINPYTKVASQVWPEIRQTTSLMDVRKEQVMEVLKTDEWITHKELLQRTGLTPGQIQKPLENLCRVRKVIRQKVIRGTAHMYVYKKYSDKLIDIIR